MPFLGTIVNVAAIIAGSLLGLLARRGIPARYYDTIMHAMGLAVILVGLKGALKAQGLILVVCSLGLGSLAGEMLGIEGRLEGLGQWLGARIAGGGREGLARGFVTASLVYCVGAMAVVGALESGLAGNHQTLFAKSAIDGVLAVVFVCSFGIGVLFSAVSVLVYQGLITLGASFLSLFLVPAVVADMSAVGGLLIMAIGFNTLGIQRLKVGNMLPAIFVPLVFFILKQMWGGLGL